MVTPRSLEPTLLKETDREINEWTHVMRAFVVSYLVEHVHLEEQRNACRLLT